MVFTAEIGKMVSCGNKIVKFVNGFYETESKQEIELLQKATGVEVVKPAKPAKTK